MFIIGKKEVAENNVSVRKHKGGDIGKFNLYEIILRLKDEVKKKVTE
jgi:threonyl-tRNA synthetase